MDDAEHAGAKPGKQEERPALIAVVAALLALATLALEVKFPNAVRAALDYDLPIWSSIILGILATAVCGYAVRRSAWRALPGIALTALYWVLLVVSLR